MNVGFIYLSIAIIAEVIATMALKASEGFNNHVYSTVCIVGYAVAFYCLSLVLKTVPVGIAYAIWSGAGIVLISLLGVLFFKQIPDLPALIGIGLIIAGLIVINLFSKTVGQ